MIRTVLFDTETTGLDPLNGDRVIEVAALELLNDLPTGKHFHALIDPQRDIPSEASASTASPTPMSPASRCSRTSPARWRTSSPTAG